MTENEFEVMDQLYFVVSFHELLELTELKQEVIKDVLWHFIDQGMVKCFRNPEEEFKVSHGDFEDNFIDYYYLASKKGLLEHNLR